MLYEDKCLRFPDQETQQQYFDLTDPDSSVNQFPQLHWDIIGTIYTDTEDTQTDADGNEVPIMEDVNGWHANIAYHFLDEFPAELNQYVIEAPVTPYRIRPVMELTAKRRKKISVSRLQADKILRLLGIKDSVDTWLATQSVDVQAAYNLAYRFDRNDVIFESVKIAFDWSDLDLDRLFIRAMEL